MITNIYRDLQEAVAARIAADEWLSTPPAVRVLTEDLGDTAKELEKDLAGPGLAVVVVTPKIEAGPAEDPAVREVVLVIGVGERPAINRGPTGTQRRSDDVACVLEAMLGQVRVLEPWRPLQFVERTTDRRSSEQIEITLVFKTSVRVTVVQESE